MYQYYNPNPLGKQVGDCVIRAISKITQQSWRDTYMEIVMEGLRMCDMPSSNSVWGSYLSIKGFRRKAIDNMCPDCYTIKDFCRDYSVGTFIVGTGARDHVVCVKDGDYYDAWDSGREVPVFYFRKES